MEETLPDGLYEVWSAVVDDVLSSRTRAEGRALEMAAVLGSTLTEREWAHLCRHVGVQSSGQLWALLETSRLVVADDTGWRFRHAMLRETLLRRQGRRSPRAVNRQCAALLRDLHVDLSGLAQGRLGRLLMEGKARRGLRYLLLAHALARWRAEQGE